MSLYGMYIQEREDKNIIETDKGFATYKFLNKDECYLVDIYVIPEERKTGLATSLADQVVAKAKEHGCNTLIGSVSLDDKEVERNAKILVSYGLKYYQINGSMVLFKKDIGGDK